MKKIVTAMGNDILNNEDLSDEEYDSYLKIEEEKGFIFYKPPIYK